MYRGVKVSLGETNRDPLMLIDMARRQVDYLGRSGIKSKAHQTDERFRKKGYLRFAPLSSKQIGEFKKRIENLGESAIVVTSFRIIISRRKRKLSENKKHPTPKKLRRSK